MYSQSHRSTISRSRHERISCLTGVFIAFIFTAPGVTHSFLPVHQRGQERLVKYATQRSQPVRLVQAKTNRRTLQFNETFLDDEEWIEGLTMSFRNISGKEVVYVGVRLTFDRLQNSSQSPAIWELQYGDDPFRYKTVESLPPLRVKSVLPNDIVDLRMTDEQYGELKLFLQSLGYPSEHSVDFRVISVGFRDNTAWYLGKTHKRDPSNPRGWSTVDAEERPKKRPKIGAHHSERPNRFSRATSSLSGRVVIAANPQVPCGGIFPSFVDCPPQPSECTVRKDNLTGTGSFALATGYAPCKAMIGGNELTCSSSTETTVAVPCPTPSPTPGTCNGIADYTSYPSSGCITGLIFGGPCTRSNAFISRCADPTGYAQETCSCPDGINTSPIIIDVDRTGFLLTDAAQGVVFDILNDSVPLQLSWTHPNSSNAFLALDRNGNNNIDNGEELFGDITPQQTVSSPNGFLALAEYDRLTGGGNQNGRVDRYDDIFPRLRLWRDLNHNGRSETSELQSLTSAGIAGIDLNYKESKKIDVFGNRFRYRAKVYDTNGVTSNRWAWDVFLTVQ